MLLVGTAAGRSKKIRGGALGDDFTRYSRDQILSRLEELQGMDMRDLYSRLDMLQERIARRDKIFQEGVSRESRTQFEETQKRLKKREEALRRMIEDREPEVLQIRAEIDRRKALRDPRAAAEEGSGIGAYFKKGKGKERQELVNKIVRIQEELKKQEARLAEETRPEIRALIKETIRTLKEGLRDFMEVMAGSGISFSRSARVVPEGITPRPQLPPNEQTAFDTDQRQDVVMEEQEELMGLPETFEIEEDESDEDEWVVATTYAPPPPVLSEEENRRILGLGCGRRNINFIV